MYTIMCIYTIMSIEMSKNHEYTNGNLLCYDYFSKHYKLIVIDLSKQTELGNPDLKQQINFIGKLEEDNGATMFFIIEKSEVTTYNFHNIMWVSYKMETHKIINLLNDSNNKETKVATKKSYVIDSKR